MTAITPRSCALLLGAGATIVGVTAPIKEQFPAGTPTGALWEVRCNLFRAFQADPEVLDSTDGATDYWDAIDAVEWAIHTSPDTSLSAAEIRLWVCWSHMGGPGPEYDPVNAGDLAAMEAIFDSLDWHEKMMLSALRSIRAIIAPTPERAALRRSVAAFNQANATFLHRSNVELCDDEASSDLCGEAAAAYRDVMACPADDAFGVVSKLAVLTTWHDDVAPPQADYDAIGAEARDWSWEAAYDRVPS